MIDFSISKEAQPLTHLDPTHADAERGERERDHAHAGLQREDPDARRLQAQRVGHWRVRAYACICLGLCFFPAGNGKWIDAFLTYKSETSNKCAQSTAYRQRAIRQHWRDYYEQTDGLVRAPCLHVQVPARSIALPVWQPTFLYHYFTVPSWQVFVIDSADGKRVEEAALELRQLVEEPKMDGVPLLILANKQDLITALQPAEARCMLEICLSAC